MVVKITDKFKDLEEKTPEYYYKGSENERQSYTAGEIIAILIRKGVLSENDL